MKEIIDIKPNNIIKKEKQDNNKDEENSIYLNKLINFTKPQREIFLKNLYIKSKKIVDKLISINNKEEYYKNNPKEYEMLVNKEADIQLDKWQKNSVD